MWTAPASEPNGLAEPAAAFDPADAFAPAAALAPRLAGTGRTTLADLAAAEEEALRFWRERMAGVAAFRDRLARCTSPFEIVAAQAEYGRAMLGAYAEAWARATALLFGGTDRAWPQAGTVSPSSGSSAVGSGSRRAAPVAKLRPRARSRA